LLPKQAPVHRNVLCYLLFPFTLPVLTEAFVISLAFFSGSETKLRRAEHDKIRDKKNLLVPKEAK
jgi:Mg2+/Co2+ transporter CorB